MAWVLRLVEIGAEGEGPCADVVEISRPDGLVDIADLGLTLAEAKLVLAGVQREIVAAQARDHAVRRPGCRRCERRLPREGLSPARDRHAVRPGRGPVAPLPLCWLRHDRGRRGMAAVCPLDPGVGSAAGAALRSADLPDGSRPARADVPGGRRPGPGDVAPPYLQGRQGPADEPQPRAVSVDAEAIVVTLDSTFIRSCEDGERHLEVRIGNVETASGRRQVFGAVAKTDTDLAGADPPQPRCGRADRGHSADGVYRRLSPGCGASFSTLASRGFRYSTGSTSPCGCNT